MGEAVATDTLWSASGADFRRAALVGAERGWSAAAAEFLPGLLLRGFFVATATGGTMPPTVAGSWRWAGKASAGQTCLSIDRACRPSTNMGSSGVSERMRPWGRAAPSPGALGAPAAAGTDVVLLSGLGVSLHGSAPESMEYDAQSVSVSDDVLDR